MGKFESGTLRYYVLVIVFCLAWSSAFPVGKIALSVCPPELFLAMRFLAAAALLLAWAALRGDLASLNRGHWLGLLALGLLNQAGYNGLTWIGMRTVSSGLSTVIISINPILIACLAAPLLREPLTRRRLVGLMLGILGVVFVVRNRIVATKEDVAGIAVIVVALLSFVAGTILYKKWSPDLPLTAVVGVQSLSAGAVLLGVGLATEDPAAIVLGAAFWLALAYNIVVVSIAAFALWFFLLNRGSATSASSLHFIMPPLGLALGHAMLGEPIDALDLIGTIPIAGGIWLVTHPARDTAEASRRATVLPVPEEAAHGD
jgi:drug/metabolite transporter (DMT)-like permease